MKKQAFNPYLPSWEYIPDGEPYVFDGRVYVYGSHDFFRGNAYCLIWETGGARGRSIGKRRIPRTRTAACACMRRT